MSILLNGGTGVVRPILLVAVTINIAAVLPIARAQNRLQEPVYRVANDISAGPPVGTAAPTVQSDPTSPAIKQLDFTQQPGEHPLAPVIRVCKASLEEIDRNIRDYSCTLVKQECIDGDLGEQQHILMKVAHEAF